MLTKPISPTVTGAGVGRYPSPYYFGYSGKGTHAYWRRLQKFCEELEQLRERRASENQAMAAKQQELQAARDTLEQDRMDAISAGKPFPDETGIEQLERALYMAEQRAAAVLRASQLAESHLREFVESGAPQEVLDEVRDRGQAHEQRYLDLLDEAQRERAKLGEIYGLHRYTRGEVASDAFMAPPAPSEFQFRQWHEVPLDWGEDAQSPESDALPFSPTRAMPSDEILGMIATGQA